MVDPRVTRVAELLVDYSTEVKRGDRVIIDGHARARDMLLELYRLCLERGAHPFLWVRLEGQEYVFYKHASEEQLKYFPEPIYHWMKNTDVYMAIRAPENLRELTNIDPAKISMHMKTLEPINMWRVEKTRWVVFYYPTHGMAQEAGMSMSEFEDFVYSACLDVDWPSFGKWMEKLKVLLDKTDVVRIEAKDTELEFSVKGRNAVVACGKRNMPDGEVFTSVVEDSVNGHIYFDVPAMYRGRLVQGVFLRFRDGQVVEHRAEVGQELLTQILNTDEGARRIGEFGIGLNYRITRPTKMILFDEKIGGTIHLAVGRGYPETLSKNKSAIHWDLIKDLRPDGRIYFDGELVMEKGRWLVLPESI